MNRKHVFMTLIVLVMFISAAVAVAGAGDPYADEVVSWTQGDRKDGGEIPADRSDPWKAVGAPDSVTGVLGTFYSLGFDGEIILGFDNYICGGDPLQVKAYEITWVTSYPLEIAEVYLSQDGSDWQYAGTVDNKGDVVAEFSALDWAKYVKIVDISDPAIHSGNGDGYDLDAVEAVTWSEGPCLIEVEIDIKPGSDPSCFNNDGNGVIPVAILGSADFDVYEVDAGTVSLEGMSVAVKGKSNKLLAAYEDVNGDGFVDLVVKIEDVDGQFSQGSGFATVTGMLLDGTPIEGTGDICITQ